MDLKDQYDRLLKYCYMKTKDRTLAEDIVQETFLRFWQSHSYEDTGKEMAYLYTIGRNLCMDAFRKKELMNIEDCPELLSMKSMEEDRVLDQMAIKMALDVLPDELREIIVMRYVVEMSSADIGKVLEMSRFSVNRRLKEGLAMLKKALGVKDRNDR